MKFGYARVSTQDQNLERQIDQLQPFGCERIFQEKITGTKKDRPELDKLLDQLRTDDVTGTPCGAKSARIPAITISAGKVKKPRITLGDGSKLY